MQRVTKWLLTFLLHGLSIIFSWQKLPLQWRSPLVYQLPTCNLFFPYSATLISLFMNASGPNLHKKCLGCRALSGANQLPAIGTLSLWALQPGFKRQQTPHGLYPPLMLLGCLFRHKWIYQAQDLSGFP